MNIDFIEISLSVICVLIALSEFPLFVLHNNANYQPSRHTLKEPVAG